MNPSSSFNTFSVWRRIILNLRNSTSFSIRAKIYVDSIMYQSDPNDAAEFIEVSLTTSMSLQYRVTQIRNYILSNYLI